MGFGFGQRRRGELPVERTSFVGRVEELRLIETGLAGSRLVTLVGPGGVGKSRTALRAAAAVRERFPDGIWLVELSSLRDAELLPATLATVLDAPEQLGMAPIDAVVAHLRCDGCSSCSTPANTCSTPAGCSATSCCARRRG
jgi:hypothetical protein